MATFRAARAHRCRSSAPRVVKRLAPTPVFAPRMASGYLTGWRAATTLRDLFPAWFATHVAHLPFTPGYLLGVAHALVMLVNTTYCELEEQEWIAWGTPEAVLEVGTTLSADEAVGILEELSGYLEHPQPVLYGIGRMFALEVDEYGMTFGPLTLALWRMAEATEWGLGIAEWEPLFQWFDARVADHVRRLPPLPARTAMDDLCRAAGWSGPREPVGAGPLPRGTLLAYAFAKTDNAAADTNNAEVTAYYGSQWSDGWESLPAWAVLTAAARQIAEAYDDWERHIAQNLTAALPALAAWLHTLAADCQRDRPPQRLIDQVALDNDDDRVIPIGDL